MSAATDTASDLLKMAAGTPLFGVASIGSYYAAVMKNDEREPIKGWFTLAAGVALVAWLTLFVCLAAPAVLHSWTARGTVEPVLVTLSGTWVVSLVFIAVALTRTRQVCAYLLDSYHQGHTPWMLRWLRRWLKD